MEAKLVSGHSKKAMPKHGKGRKATHMRIERAENGVMVHTDHERPEMSKSQMASGMGGYEMPEKHMFNDRKAMMDHIADKFGDVLPEGEMKGAAKAGGKSKGPETEEDTDEMD